MQAAMKTIYQQALLGSNVLTRRALPLAVAKTPKFFTMPRRFFASEMEVQKKQEQSVDLDTQMKKIGVDLQFSEQKHAYVLTFPWNFPEIISDFEHEYRPLSASSYWGRFVFDTDNILDFNHLFREFH